jgi:hypothetical protein
MLEKLLRELETELAEATAQIFANPPKSMEEFRERLGGYHATKAVRDKIYRVVAGLEDEVKDDT